MPLRRSLRSAPTALASGAAAAVAAVALLGLVGLTLGGLPLSGAEAPRPLAAAEAGLAPALTAPDTTGIYTKAQAEAGKELYEVQCAMCHGPREFAGGIFQRRWLVPPVSGIFVHIMNTMPQDAPGSLAPAQVATLVAYILELNGQPTGPVPLPTEMEKLAQIRVQIADEPDTSTTQGTSGSPR